MDSIPELSEVAAAIERLASNTDFNMDVLAASLIAAGLHAGNEGMTADAAGSRAVETLLKIRSKV